jgi:hypothetical protein
MMKRVMRNTWGMVWREVNISIKSANSANYNVDERINDGRVKWIN